MRIINKVFLKLYSIRTKIIGKALLPYIHDSESVLDFGCSTMAVTRYISSFRKIDLHGVDVKDYNIPNVKFCKYDGGKLPFKDNQFDVVLSIFVSSVVIRPSSFVASLILLK